MMNQWVGKTPVRSWSLMVLLVCGSLDGLQAQSPSGSLLVRMGAGDGARIFAGGGQQVTEIRLGLPAPPGPTNAGLALLPPGGRLQSICCTQAPGLQCLTERSVTLGTREKDVLARYGPPKNIDGGVWFYSGINFRLGPKNAGPLVDQICVVPR